LGLLPARECALSVHALPRSDSQTPVGAGMSARVSRSIRLTFISETTAVLAAVWVTRRVAIAYPTGVTAYLVLRQILNWFMGVGFWGLNISLPRAIAADHRVDARRRLVFAAALLTLPMLLVLILVALFAPRLASLLLLHDPGTEPIFVAASFLFVC